MIHAAIVDWGRWGRSLVNAVQDSTTFAFVVAHTRTRAKAEEFCQSKGGR